MYLAPYIHEHFTIHKWLRETAYILTHNLNNLEHIANNCMNVMTHTDVTIAHHWARCAAFRCVVVHAFIHRTCGSSFALCVIPCHPCMRTCVWLLECSLFTRLSTSSSSPSSTSSWCLPWCLREFHGRSPVQVQVREYGQPGLCHTRHTDSDISPVPVSNSVDNKSGQPDETQATKNQNQIKRKPR